jgi:hypothetical protein
MTKRFVDKSYTFEKQRQEINLIAEDLDDLDTSFEQRVNETIDSTDLLADKISDISAPSVSIDPGETGQIKFDSEYIYICVATNTWKRSPISSWP